MRQNKHLADWSSLAPHTQHKATAAALENAELLESRLHAFISLSDGMHVTAESAIAGMPYAIKDIFASRGRLPTCGLDRGVDIGFSDDAEVLKQLDQNGAVRIGFCTMTELAYEPSGYNAVRAAARNPWNSDFIPGGSSSGSAVAVASGSVVFALGSDTGGSVRIPAQACGVTAWKPTIGRVSTEGAMALAPTLDTIGILARSAADLAAPAGILFNGKPDTRPIERLVVLADLLAAAEPDVRHACEAGVDAIAAAGAMEIRRRDAGPAIKIIDAHALIVLQAEPPRIHRSLVGESGIDTTLRKRFTKGLSIDDTTLAASRAARADFARQFIESILDDADAALLPVMPICTPSCDLCDPESKTFDARTLYRLSQWTRFVNMLGFPALAIPVGFDNRGLPVGLQIVGRPDQDFALIALAAAAQRLTDWHGRVPSGIADTRSDKTRVQ